MSVSVISHEFPSISPDVNAKLASIEENLRQVVQLFYCKGLGTGETIGPEITQVDSRELLLSPELLVSTKNTQLSDSQPFRRHAECTAKSNLRDLSSLESAIIPGRFSYSDRLWEPKCVAQRVT